VMSGGHGKHCNKMNIVYHYERTYSLWFILHMFVFVYYHWRENMHFDYYKNDFLKKMDQNWIHLSNY
jgi:hypothetical protein